MNNHLVMFSGGVGSWAAAKRVPDPKVLVFADTLMEDEDLYRFLDEAAVDVGGELVKLTEGRDPWQVFHDERYLGNTRIDPCSKILKRQLIRRWIEENYDPVDTIIYLGIDWTESHRFKRARLYWDPWKIEAPLCKEPYLSKNDLFTMLAEAEIRRPRLYDMGFPHNNCGGFCIKAGQAWFKLLLKKFPERYCWHENKEQELRNYLGKDVAILRDRRGGITRPMTLRTFRRRLQDNENDYDKWEWGGCGCFSNGDMTDGEVDDELLLKN